MKLGNIFSIGENEKNPLGIEFLAKRPWRYNAPSLYVYKSIALVNKLKSVTNNISLFVDFVGYFHFLDNINK